MYSVSIGNLQITTSACCAHNTIINKKKMSKIFDSNSFKGLTVVIVIIWFSVKWTIKIKLYYICLESN